MARSPRVPINATPGKLNTAFAALSADGLPEPPPSAVEPEPAEKPARRGRVVLRRETAHRGGKMVTVVHDFPAGIGVHMIEDLARTLRQACGCGGAVKGRTIELQGDQAARLRPLLAAAGFRVAGVR